MKITESQINAIRALRQFNQAHNDLLEAWSNDTNNFDLNNTKSVKLYPFESSFDEYNVYEWVHQTIKEIGGSVEDAPMLRPECLECNVCCVVTKDLTGRPLEHYYHQCIADGCDHDVYMNYDRAAVIKYLKTGDVNCMHDDDADIENAIMNGLEGLDEMTDVELLFEYNRSTGEETSTKEVEPDVE